MEAYDEGMNETVYHLSNGFPFEFNLTFAIVVSVLTILIAIFMQWKGNAFCFIDKKKLFRSIFFYVIEPVLLSLAMVWIVIILPFIFLPFPFSLSIIIPVTIVVCVLCASMRIM